MFVEIKVTKQDIKLGKPCRTTVCPVARAIKRKLKGNIRVGTFNNILTNTVVYYYRKNNDDDIEFNKTVSKIIDNYDETGEMEPFSFKLRLKK